MAWVPVGLALATSAPAQEFEQVQRLTSTVLFAKEDRAASQREAERRRIDALDQKARQQAVLLEQQAASVRQLADQLQQVRDEQRLLDLATAFDDAILAGRAGLARALLADEVAIGFVDPAGAAPTSVSADVLVAGPPLSTAAGGVLPRANQRVRMDGERATLTSDGYAWRSVGKGRGSLDQRAGRWEYRFVRSPLGWKIDGLFFTRAMIAP